MPKPFAHNLMLKSFCLAVALTAAAGTLACGNGSSTGTLARSSGGNYFDDAIKVGSIGEERDIMNRTSCGNGGHYRKAHVTVVERDGRHYDVIDAECSTGSAPRQYYFDVSSCFPCPN